eukprot:6553713-Karenia_brevis.AAC.1
MWGVLTVGFVICRQETRWTSVRQAGGRTCLELHTSSLEPLFQAIVMEEDERTMRYALEDATTLCKKYGDFELKRTLIQVHKDYSPGMEKARKVLFPAVRCVQDYWHLKHAARPQLEKKLQNRMAIDVGEGKGKKHKMKKVQKTGSEAKEKKESLKKRIYVKTHLSK